MKKIIAIGASNSRESINKIFADYAANQVNQSIVETLDLNDYEMPIYGIDRERADGIPQLAYDFKKKLIEADGIVISFAEHNGTYAVAFKNIMDWISRLEGSTWDDKPMFLLATSPGARGGKTALDIAVDKFKYMTKNSVSHFSLPSFSINFSNEEGIKDMALRKEFKSQIQVFELSINASIPA